ncbi:hypothetical protein E3N88_25050 [Mikania micrantha]|uniref:Uncharacterized protein n=1 Tax=Mikania micrantha TaxID=192012 RepID=A0A5N6N4L7_9ASTR|nr:hypothetical protein E3N88_25050 [Mikania micrantha]
MQEVDDSFGSDIEVVESYRLFQRGIEEWKGAKIPRVRSLRSVRIKVVAQLTYPGSRLAIGMAKMIFAAKIWVVLSIVLPSLLLHHGRSIGLDVLAIYEEEKELSSMSFLLAESKYSSCREEVSCPYSMAALVLLFYGKNIGY